MRNCSALSWRDQVTFRFDDGDIEFVLDQHTLLDLYNAISLKQQSACRHVAPLGHIIPIPNSPDFAPYSYCCVISGEATNTNFINLWLTWTWLEPTIYRTRGAHANHYTIDVAYLRWSQGNKDRLSSSTESSKHTGHTSYLSPTTNYRSI